MASSQITRKDKAELLMKLGDTHWRNFDTRRSYEWKSNFVVWTSLAAFLAILAKGDVKLSPAMVGVCSVAVLGIFFIYWLPWTTGMWRRNYKDMRLAAIDWCAVRTILSVEIPKDQEPAPPLKYSKEDYRTVWWTWSRGSQLGITALFTAAVLCAIWFPVIFAPKPYCT